MSQRVAKVESLVQQTVAGALSAELEASAAYLTVTRVDVSPDLRQAIVWIGLLGPVAGHEALMTAIKRRSGALQAAVAARLTTRVAPRLVFRADSGGAYAAEIEQLLKRSAA